MAKQSNDDLFITALRDLHNEAPIELLTSLRAHLEHTSQTNPNTSQTAQACLKGISSDSSTLLHVLTAAYLINGGVMLKHAMPEDKAADDFNELEEELRVLSKSLGPPSPPAGRTL